MKRWVAGVCVLGMLCGVLCSCAGTHSSESKLNSAPNSLTSVTTTSATTMMRTTTTIMTTKATTSSSVHTTSRTDATSTTTKTRPGYVGPATTHTLPKEKHPPEERRKCYVNYLGERVLVTFQDGYGTDENDYWRYSGTLSDGYTLSCYMKDQAQRVSWFTVDYPTYPKVYGAVDENIVRDSSVSLLAKMGFVYAENEVHYQMLVYKLDHRRGDRPTTRYEVSANNEENGSVSLLWAKTSLGDRINRIIFYGQGAPVEWVL